MDISSIDTLMNQAMTQQAHAAKINSMVKDQMETNGALAVELVESASTRPVDPSSPVGQNIDIHV
ncbi:hypothetical protein GCM10011352_30480 [Marinobacterium zhoushanense]|uniref:Motility protein YjfB-like n=1 Tax=Marinobacterium zhoushanense TaxID=1679163 RepID=A0ABQ1KK00_9GAMM|nr:hypothetical protein [Marinobacterium zhoushanense]GGC02190.1 hypothetical protein GCM10011352_30480 [Marinobacterium zhoushanense]